MKSFLNKNIFKQIVTFIICFMLMGVVAVNQNKKLFNIKMHNVDSQNIEVVTEDNGLVTVNTSPLTENIVGYVSTTPVEILIKDNKIEKIKVLPNKETPEFLGAVLNSDLLDSWNGKTLQEAENVKADAVSGATISSNSIIKNIQVGIAYANKNVIAKSDEYNVKLDFKFFFVIFIILIASILPLFIKNKLYRNIQLIVNVIILGFWGGTFINYSIMSSLMANGIRSILIIPVLLMLVTAFIYPFFGKKNYYCLWICPYGSIQELAGKIIKFKIKLSPNVTKIMIFIRDAIWVFLMFFIMTGIWVEWMGWEPFAAFYFREASPIVLSIAGAFLLLSFFINRPYCRFVCPTGTLFKISEGTK